MDVTLSIDDETLARAKEVAEQRGVTIDALVQGYLEELTSRMSGEEMIERLDQLWNDRAGNSGGRAWTREELHERADVH